MKHYTCLCLQDISRGIIPAGFKYSVTYKMTFVFQTKTQKMVRGWQDKEKQSGSQPPLCAVTVTQRCSFLFSKKVQLATQDNVPCFVTCWTKTERNPK
jgi:hypothetical protein